MTKQEMRRALITITQALYDQNPIDNLTDIAREKQPFSNLSKSNTKHVEEIIKILSPLIEDL